MREAWRKIKNAALLGGLALVLGVMLLPLILAVLGMAALLALLIVVVMVYAKGWQK